MPEVTLAISERDARCVSSEEERAVVILTSLQFSVIDLSSDEGRWPLRNKLCTLFRRKESLVRIVSGLFLGPFARSLYRGVFTESIGYGVYKTPQPFPTYLIKQNTLVVGSWDYTYLGLQFVVNLICVLPLGFTWCIVTGKGECARYLSSSEVRDRSELFSFN